MKDYVIPRNFINYLRGLPTSAFKDSAEEYLAQVSLLDTFSDVDLDRAVAEIVALAPNRQIADELRQTFSLVVVG